MDKLNRNSDAKKNQSDNKEIQDFFRSKADLDNPILTKKQCAGIKKNKKVTKGFRSKLKEVPMSIEPDLFNFNNQYFENGEKEFSSNPSDNFDNNNCVPNCSMIKFKEIGAILKEKRKAKNLTQKQLAVLAYNEITYQGLISRIESGTYKEIRFQDILIILSAFGIDLMELIINSNLNDETN
jgi:hypothetical protein